VSAGPWSIAIPGPDDLLTAIPYVLQFQPDEALVIVLSQNGRIDFVGHFDLSVPYTSAQLWHMMAPEIDRHAPDHLFIIGYGPAAITARLIRYAHDAPVPVRDVLRVWKERRWCLWPEDPACSDEGHRLQPQADVSAPLTLSGLSVAPSRDALAHFLAPAPAAVLQQVQAEIDGDTERGWTPAERYRAVWDAHQARQDGPVELSESDAARVLQALSDPDVHAACLDWHDNATWWLWTDLIRLTPAHLVPTVTVLIATAAYQRGETPLALAATEHALRADPGCREALALWRALDAGVLAGEVVQAARTSATAAREDTRLRDSSPGT
jgi:hypothetical protein